MGGPRNVSGVYSNCDCVMISRSWSMVYVRCVRGCSYNTHTHDQWHQTPSLSRALLMRLEHIMMGPHVISYEFHEDFINVKCWEYILLFICDCPMRLTMTVIRRSRPSGHSLIRVSHSQPGGEMLISSPLLRLFVIVMTADNPSLRRPGIITIQRMLTFLCKRERGNKNSRLSLCCTTAHANPLSPLSPCFYFVRAVKVWSRDGTKVQEKLRGQPPLTTPGDEKENSFHWTISRFVLQLQQSQLRPRTLGNFL